VFLHVEDVRSAFDQLVAAFKIQAHGQRAGFGGFVACDARQELPANLESRRAVHGRFLDSAKPLRSLSYLVEIDLVPRHDR
jgi:hypothetical protein